MAVKQFAPLQVVSMKGWKISFNTPGIMKGALTAMTTWETRVQSYENFHTGNRDTCSGQTIQFKNTFIWVIFELSALSW